MSAYRYHGQNDEAVFIVDKMARNQRSVTNDAEAVTEEVVRCWGDKRIIYRDTLNNWDELRHSRGKFAGFYPLSAIDRRRFQEWLI